MSWHTCCIFDIMTYFTYFLTLWHIVWHHDVFCMLCLTFLRHDILHLMSWCTFHTYTFWHHDILYDIMRYFPYFFLLYLLDDPTSLSPGFQSLIGLNSLGDTYDGHTSDPVHGPSIALWVGGGGGGVERSTLIYICYLIFLGGVISDIWFFRGQISDIWFFWVKYLIFDFVWVRYLIFDFMGGGGGRGSNIYLIAFHPPSLVLTCVPYI